MRILNTIFQSKIIQVKVYFNRLYTKMDLELIRSLMIEPFLENNFIVDVWLSFKYNSGINAKTTLKVTFSTGDFGH